MPNRPRIPKSQYPLCPCGNRVKGRINQYCSPACIPHAVHVAAGRKGRKAYAYKRRAIAFRADLERLGRNLTREDLLDVFQTIYKRGYTAGFQCGKVRRDALEAMKALPLARERGAA